MKAKRIIKTLFFLFLFSGTISSLFAQEEFLDSKNRLREMTFEDEIFIPEIKNAETVLINKAGNIVSREFYDKSNRLVKKEDWEISEASESKVVRFETYDYFEGSDIVQRKSVITSDSEIKYEFNKDGKPKREDTYVLWEDEETKEVLKKRTVSSLWTYDTKNRLLVEKVVSYHYADEKSLKYEKTTSEQKQYSYHEDSETPPDFSVFINGIKKSMTLYSGKNDYRTDLFFDEGYVVRTYFVEGIRRKEEIYENGKLQRQKEYE